MKLQVIKDNLQMDTISKKGDVITVRKSYYYRSGKTEEIYVQRVKELFPNAVIVVSGDSWGPFRGGQSVAQGSHFYVKFQIEPTKEMPPDGKEGYFEGVSAK